jgi:hypothetical protein
MNISEVFHSADISYLVVVVVFVVVATKMVKILHFQKKVDLVCWQAQYIIHIRNHLFILRTTNEKLLSSFQFIGD